MNGAVAENRTPLVVTGSAFEVTITGPTMTVALSTVYNAGTITLTVISPDEVRTLTLTPYDIADLQVSCYGLIRVSTHGKE